MHQTLKYQLPDYPVQPFTLQLTGRLRQVLTVQLQGNTPVLYTVEMQIPKYEQSDRLKLYSVMTGQAMHNPNTTYLGTVQLPGPFVLHYFMQ